MSIVPSCGLSSSGSAFRLTPCSESVSFIMVCERVWARTVAYTRCSPASSRESIIRETENGQGCFLESLLFNIFFAVVLDVTLAFSCVDLGVVEDMVKMKRRNTEAGEKECSQAWDAERIFQEVWGMLDADDAGIASRSPGTSGNMMEGIVRVCMAFGLTVSETKAEIMCLHGMNTPMVAFRVNAACRVNKEVLGEASSKHPTSVWRYMCELCDQPLT